MVIEATAEVAIELKSGGECSFVVAKKEEIYSRREV